MSLLSQINVLLLAIVSIFLLGLCVYAGYQHWPYTNMVSILLFMSFIKAYNKTTLNPSTSKAKTLQPTLEAAQPKDPLPNRIFQFVIRFFINIPLFAISVVLLYGLGYLAHHLFS